MENILPCEQLYMDNNWSMTRKNACHIGNMNSEMGTLAKNQIEMNTTMQVMGTKQTMSLLILGAIGLAFIGLAVKKVWGNNDIS